MITFTVMRQVEASAEMAWNIISDFEKSPCSSISVRVEEKGDPESNGIGTIRTVTVNGRQVRERLESANPPYSLTYRMLSGAPVKEYIGNIDVKAHGDTALIQWHVEFSPKVFGTGWIIKRFAEKTIHYMIDEVVAEHR
jgi:hypothetical protein